MHSETVTVSPSFSCSKLTFISETSTCDVWPVPQFIEAGMQVLPFWSNIVKGGSVVLMLEPTTRPH